MIRRDPDDEEGMKQIGAVWDAPKPYSDGSEKWRRLNSDGVFKLNKHQDKQTKETRNNRKYSWTVIGERDFGEGEDIEEAETSQWADH